MLGELKSTTAVGLVAWLGLAMAAHAQETTVDKVPIDLINYADIVVVNGKILTVDKNDTVAEAVAIRDGLVLAVGKNDDIKRFAGPDTKVLDVAGRSVVPGFIDSDGDNAFAGGDLYKDTMINGKIGKKIKGKSVPDMLDAAKALLEKAEPGSKVFLRMSDEFINDLSKLRIEDIDKLSPNNPIMLAFSSSEGIVNTAMLEIGLKAGLDPNHVGLIKDSNGKYTGQIASQAMGFFGWNLRDWPELTEDIFKAQEDINNDFLKIGVTTVTGHASGYTVSIMNQMIQNDRQKLRVRPDLDFARQNPMADQILRRVPNLVGAELGDGILRVVGAAMGPADGASDAGGILTNDLKVQDHPEVRGGKYGTNKWVGSNLSGMQWVDLTEAQKEQTEFNTLKLLREHGWNIGGNHNMGSLAAVLVMTGLKEAEGQPAIKVHPMAGRNALDHNLIWDEKSIALAKELGDNMAFGLNSEIWSQRVVRGTEMLSYQYGDKLHTMQPVKDLIAAGLNVHFEGGDPDQPPMWRIERFVTRTDLSTEGENMPAGRVWGKDQAIDRMTALRMTTYNAAKFITEEDKLGSIEAGKYADIAIIDGDYTAVPDDGIDELKIAATIVNGDVVYDAGVLEGLQKAENAQ